MVGGRKVYFYKEKPVASSVFVYQVYRVIALRYIVGYIVKFENFQMLTEFEIEPI